MPDMKHPVPEKPAASLPFGERVEQIAEKDSMEKEASTEAIHVRQNALQSRYVVGFMFDPYYQRVACIRKNKPTWQAGKLNGIGGKIEDGESPKTAMRREFNEEAGFDCSDWRHYARLHGTNNDGGSFELHCFWSQTERLGFTSQETEKIEIISVAHIAQRVDTIGNLPWLITMARDCAMNLSPLGFADVVYGKADSVSDATESYAASGVSCSKSPLLAARQSEKEQQTLVEKEANLQR